MEPRPNYRAPRLRRPPGQDPPHGRRLDETYKLDQQSQTALRPGEWLDDSIVDTFLRSLCIMQPGQCVTLDSVALDSFHSKVWGGTGQTSDQIDELCKPLRTLAATVSGNGGLVFFPICLVNHWILAVADLHHRIIRIYDAKVQCDPSGAAEQSWVVSERVLPMVKCILSFCLDANEWTVEPFWLPIKENYTECGVYICLMALQHSYSRRFTHNHYVTSFRDEHGTLSHYQLDECYWFAGRRIIFQVCRRFFNPTRLIASGEDQIIALELRKSFDEAPAQQQLNGFNTYRMARSCTLRWVIDALAWMSNTIASMSLPQNLHQNAWIQSRACEPVLTLSGEQFRNEIVEEAIRYAWHDPEPLAHLIQDINTAMNILRWEDQDSEVRLAIWLARQAQLAQAGAPSVHPSSSGDSDTSSSVVVVELDVTSPAPTTTDAETPSAAHPESPSISEAEKAHAES